MSLSVEIEGLNELLEVAKKFPAEAAKEINDAIKKSILSLLGSARRFAPVDQGFLRGGGMQTRFSTLKGTLENTSPYAMFVHEGTKPHWPPLDAIEPWAKRHGIPAFLVARKIATKGTEAKPFFNQAIDEEQKTMDNLFEKALNNLVNKL